MGTTDVGDSGVLFFFFPMQFQNEFYPIVSEQSRGRKQIGPDHQMYIKEAPFHLESIPHGFYLTTLSKSIRLVYSMVLKIDV
jgi:hypothetical protein